MATFSFPITSYILLLVLVLTIPGHHVLHLFTAQATASVPWKKQGYDIGMIERLIHNRVNAERKKIGLGPLDWNESLHDISRKHSHDMVTRNYFSHTSPEGAGFSERYQAAHFSCSIEVGQNIYSGAENISQDNLFDSVRYRNDVPTYDWKTSDEIARSVVSRWMGSIPHRKNILFPHWTSQGLGISVADDGKVLVTENFC